MKGALPTAPLALTMGDPAGIGPDITLMAWVERVALALPAFGLYADPGVLRARARSLGLAVPVEIVGTLEAAAGAFATALPVIDVGSAGQVTAGRPSTSAAAAIIASVDHAVAAVQAGAARAIVTNPIAKSVLYAAGFKHPGHTEYLAHLAGVKLPVMMLAADELRVVPVTIHIPLRAVPVALTAEVIMATIEATYRSLRADFAIAAPRIAVAGLNPHAGEGGSIGTEDRDLIAPVIASLRRDRGWQVTGPHSADTLFHASARAGYDAAVCMYHDQALIPIKTLAFDRGVNTTLGLPFVRTSPDHGTAFDIAGTGAARAQSLFEALRLADAMARRRRGPSA